MTGTSEPKITVQQHRARFAYVIHQEGWAPYVSQHRYGSAAAAQSAGEADALASSPLLDILDDICRSCGGSGERDGTECSNCNGWGRIGTSYPPLIRCGPALPQNTGPLNREELQS